MLTQGKFNQAKVDTMMYPMTVKITVYQQLYVKKYGSRLYTRGSCENSIRVKIIRIRFFFQSLKTELFKSNFVIVKHWASKLVTNGCLINLAALAFFKPIQIFLISYVSRCEYLARHNSGGKNTPCRVASVCSKSTVDTD
jgi:hypothetical protein